MHRTASPMLVGSVLTLLAIAPLSASDTTREQARLELGELLFDELLFTDPAADYGASCSGCHQTGNSIPNRAERHWADYTPHSLEAHKTTTSRNTPTLEGVARAERLGWAGQWATLEEAIESQLLGSEMGWRPEDRERALAAIQFTLLEEGSGGGTGPGYVDRFRDAWSIDLTTATPAQSVAALVTALVGYVQTIDTSYTAKWDAFAEQNRFQKEPIEGESAIDYAFGIESRIGNQEGRRLIRRPEGFSEEAYEGFKIFFRVYGEEGQSVGNCIVCHVTPDFTDHQMRATGSAQLAYDAVHGEGAFTKLELPDEPTEATASPPDSDHPERVDLGWWNHAPAAERNAALGAFKTPTLRNLAGTDPYGHDGRHATLEDVVREKMRLGEMAREGKLRAADPAMADIRLEEDDVSKIVAFLEQLEDVGEERFRYYLIHFDN